jgi:hypothetical protein
VAHLLTERSSGCYSYGGSLTGGPRWSASLFAHAPAICRWLGGPSGQFSPPPELHARRTGLLQWTRPRSPEITYRPHPYASGLAYGYKLDPRSPLPFNKSSQAATPRDSKCNRGEERGWCRHRHWFKSRWPFGAQKTDLCACRMLWVLFVAAPGSMTDGMARNCSPLCKLRRGSAMVRGQLREHANPRWVASYHDSLAVVRGLDGAQNPVVVPR